MSLRNPFGWDLPAGVTNADIDRHFGNPNEIECTRCANSFIPEDEEKLCPRCRTHSDCCDAPLEDGEICSKCKEHI